MPREYDTSETMKVKRLPVILSISGMALKTLLMLVWRIFHVPELLSFWSTYDLGALWFARQVSALLFDPRGIAPSSGEAMLFAPPLVVGFGIECFATGVLIRMVVRWIQGRRPNGIITGSAATGINRPS